MMAFIFAIEKAYEFKINLWVKTDFMCIVNLVHLSVMPVRFLDAFAIGGLWRFIKAKKDDFNCLVDKGIVHQLDLFPKLLLLR